MVGSSPNASACRLNPYIEFHAGAEYREFGLETGLMNRGCEIENPTLGMGIGIQPRFYKEAQQVG